MSATAPSAILTCTPEERGRCIDGWAFKKAANFAQPAPDLLQRLLVLIAQVIIVILALRCFIVWVKRGSIGRVSCWKRFRRILNLLTDNSVREELPFSIAIMRIAHLKVAILA